MIKEQISQLIEETARQHGYMIYESSIFLKGVNSKIIVKIDSEADISHLDCEKYSKELSAKLDDEKVLPNYSLEVSSPGLNRYLRTLGEFSRFPGAPVKVVYQDGEERTFVKGRIAAVDDTSVMVAADNVEVTIQFKSIIYANLDY